MEEEMASTPLCHTMPKAFTINFVSILVISVHYYCLILLEMAIRISELDRADRKRYCRIRCGVWADTEAVVIIHSHSL